MIPLDFSLFFSGPSMSYLRYLCFKTLRHFHPNSRIRLFTTDKYKIDDHNWSREKQDFETNELSKDYREDLKDLGVEIKTLTGFAENLNPVVQSDLARYQVLHINGGVYLDTDQIILKSFESLPLEYDFLYSLYFNPQCGPYLPTGVFAVVKEHPVMAYIMKHIVEYYRPNNYNSTGPFMWLDIIKKVDLGNAFNVPSVYWYPVLHSDLVGTIYDGSFEIPKVSVALHLFLGHPLSQEFNKKYTPEFAATSNDTISKFLREKNLL